MQSILFILLVPLVASLQSTSDRPTPAYDGTSSNSNFALRANLNSFPPTSNFDSLSRPLGTVSAFDLGVTPPSGLGFSNQNLGFLSGVNPQLNQLPYNPQSLGYNQYPYNQLAQFSQFSNQVPYPYNQYPYNQYPVSSFMFQPFLQNQLNSFPGLNPNYGFNQLDLTAAGYPYNSVYGSQFGLDNFGTNGLGGRLPTSYFPQQPLLAAGSTFNAGKVVKTDGSRRPAA